MLRFLLPSLLSLISIRAQITPRECPYDQGKIDFYLNDSSVPSTRILRTPFNARTIIIGRMVDFEFVEPSVFYETDLERRRTFPTSAEAEALLIDISDRAIRENAWYLVCVEFDAPFEDVDKTDELVPLDSLPPYARKAADVGRKLNISFTDDTDRCTRCSAIKARSDQWPSSTSAKFVRYSWLPNRSTDGSRFLRFTSSDDMPFRAVVVWGWIIDVETRTVAFQVSRPIRPRQQVFVRVPHLLDDERRYLTDFYVTPLDKRGSEMRIDAFVPTLYDQFL